MENLIPALGYRSRYPAKAPANRIRLNITHKKLPTGWQYALTLRALKTYLRSNDADVRCVEYSGALNSTYGDFWVPATFESRAIENCLVFRLSFAGTPSEVLESTGRDWSVFTIDSLQDFLHQCNENIAITTRPRRGSIRISRFNDVDDYSVEYDWSETDKRKLPFTPWW